MRARLIMSMALVLLCSTALFAQSEPAMSAEQKAMMEAWEKAGTPGEPHKKLNKMVGTWNATMRWYPAPGAPPSVSQGVSRTRWILGNRYLEQRFTGQAMGQKLEGIGYTGYDNIKQRYFSTWMDNMSTGVMTSTGDSETPNVYLMTGTMDDPMTGKAQNIEQKITVINDDKHTFEMWSPGPDGQMYRAMEITYTRQKAAKKKG